MDDNLDFANFYHIYPPLAIHGWKATDLSFNLAPSYRDLKDPTTRQNFDDTPGQIPKLILTLRLKQLRIFSYQLNFMLESQISHIGHKRCIPENDFFSFMTEAIKSVMGVIEKIDTVKSLRNISKENIFLHKIPIHCITLRRSVRMSLGICPGVSSKF